MRTGKYRLLGTLLLAGALCLTGCGSTESNADVMAADVQQTGLLEDSADSGSGGDSGITPQESGQSSVLPPLSTEAQTIDYKGNVHVDWLTASSDAIYLLSRDQDGGSGILKMKPGEADGEALQVTAPDGMTFSVMTTDEQGNLYVVAEDRDIEAVMRDDEVVCPTEHCEVWRVSPSGEVTAKLDGRDGHIGDATSFMLRSDGSFYSNVCPGRDCDLVIFGGEGILGYDLGSANIKWKVPAGKLPFSTEGFYPMAALADGRILFLDSNKLHYVPAAQQ